MAMIFVEIFFENFTSPSSHLVAGMVLVINLINVPTAVDARLVGMRSRIRKIILGAARCSRAVRMLLYADVETSFLAARVLLHGVFLLPEYRHLLSNATIVYLGRSCFVHNLHTNTYLNWRSQDLGTMLNRSILKHSSGSSRDLQIALIQSMNCIFFSSIQTSWILRILFLYTLCSS